MRTLTKQLLPILLVSSILILTGCKSSNIGEDNTTTSGNIISNTGKNGQSTSDYTAPNEPKLNKKASSGDISSYIQSGSGIPQLSNTASKYCISNSGSIEIRKNKKGEYGVCVFEDNRQCEEWSLIHGNCPVGGVKVTGYDNDAEIFCAITGGEVQGVGTNNSMCKRVDGTLCKVQDNLDGECPNPFGPKPKAK